MARRIAPALAATMITACGGDGAPTDLPDASSVVADARAAMTMVRSAHLGMWVSGLARDRAY